MALATTHTMTRRRFLSTSLAAVGLAACEREPLSRLRIGAYLYPAHEPLFLGRHLGALDERLINLAEYPTASELMLSFRNRALDVITVTLDDALRLASYGHDVRIISLLARSHGADALVGRKEMADPTSLRGKTVGFESDTLGAYLLAKALDAHGIGPDEVIMRPARVDRLSRQLSMGAVDGLVTYEPHLAAVKRMGGKVLFDSAQIPGQIISVLVARADSLQPQRAALEQVIKGWEAGLQHLQAEPRAAAAIVGPRERQTTDLFVESLKLLRFVSMAENRRLLAPGDSELPALLEKCAGFMARYDLLPRAVAVTALRDDRFVKQGA